MAQVRSPLHPASRFENPRFRRGATELFALGLTTGALLFVVGLVWGAWTLMTSAQAWHLRDTSLDGLPLVEGPVIEVAQATRGRALFLSTCATCHGGTGRGQPGLGKDLVLSAFCRGLDDGELFAFVRKGREATDPLNTTGIAMPPSGGNPTLSDAQVTDVVAYVRALQNRERMPVLPVPTTEHVMDVLMAMAPALPTAGASGESGDARYEDPEYETGDITMGARLYAMSCVSCHGVDGRGLPKLGKDLVASTFIQQMTDDEAIIAFLGKGRSTSDPLNTTKVDMPPRGGNPALNDDRLFQIVAYLRWLQKHPGQQ